MCPPLVPVARHVGPSDDDTDAVPIPLNVAYINCYGQSKFPISKQLKIQSFICQNNLDIIHLQEIKVDQDSFSQFGFVSSNFNIFANNKPDGSNFGTASLVRSDLDVSDIHTDNDGRIIVFNAAECTWGNFYLPSGSSRNARSSSKEYFSLTIPQLMLHLLPQGAAGGDFNSIIVISDSKKNSQSNMSPSCRNLVNAFLWIDSYRRLHLKKIQFSRYQNTDADGATRIDRFYQWGNIIATESQYHSISFSDHLCLRISYNLPHKLDCHLAPKSKPSYKIPP